MLAIRITGDPFAKAKGLIQELIERLIQESINEATKQGFCNTELAKARPPLPLRGRHASQH